jgi:choline dehydrogenase
LAYRLSEIPEATVLVLEAGEAQMSETVDIPYRWTEHLFTDIDWAYMSVPQPALGNRPIYSAAGKGVGGSTNLYQMIHIRGHALDYDNWAYHGCTSWKWEDVLPYFKKLENQEDNTNPTAGKGGPINVINPKNHHPNPLSQTFIDACLELGYPYTEDFNANLTGVGWHHLDMKDGKRYGARSAYLEPALTRSNVTLSPRSFATRLLFEGKRCVGVEYVQDNERKEVRANHEVILCASGVQSPKLLMLSGIGRAEHLRPFNIPVIVDLPGVGENFHDHALMVAPVYICSRETPEPHLNVSECCLFCNTEDWLVPDLQIGFLHRAPFQAPHRPLFAWVSGQPAPKPDPKLITALPGLVRPLSRGRLRLASSNPLDNPLIDPNYMVEETDFKRMVRAFEIVREIFHTKAFAEWGVTEVAPGPDVKSDGQVQEFMRQNIGAYYHYAGACKMGVDKMAVADPHLRVYGVEGLRVADASVIPEVPTGNSQTTVLMIAERAADFIKQETLGRT